MYFFKKCLASQLSQKNRSWIGKGYFLKIFKNKVMYGNNKKIIIF